MTKGRVDFVDCPATTYYPDKFYDDLKNAIYRQVDEQLKIYDIFNKKG